MGDFNCNFLEPDSSSVKSLKQILQLFSLDQIIETATRITDVSTSLLDLICINPLQTILQHGIVDLLHLSDHFLTYCIIDISIPDVSRPTALHRSFKSFNYNHFIQDAQGFDWQTIDQFLSIEDKINYLNYEVRSLFDKHAPLIQHKPNKKSSRPYITYVIKIMLSEKRKYYKKYLKSKMQSDLVKYREMRNYVSEAIKREKKAYFHFQINKFGNNSKKMWNFFDGENVHHKQRNEISSDIKDANAVNDYFMNSTPKFAVEQSAIDKYYSSKFKEFPQMLALQEITLSDVCTLINKLSSNATGLDGINAKMLKLMPIEVLTAIRDVINFSLQIGSFPESWKQAIITPLAKVKLARDMSELRPIHVIPTISKIIERWVFEQLLDHIESNNVLSEYQSGFGMHYSTTTALMRMVNDFVDATDRREAIQLICLDFSKAFDLINHELLAKLHYYGCSDSTLTWFRSYMSGREHCTRLGNDISTSVTVKYGVPQGTILGPLLFLIYTADLQTVISPECKSHFYADDTQIYVSCNPVNIDNKVTILNQNLESICVWAKENGLQINPKKSTAMCIGNPQIRSQCLAKMSSTLTVEKNTLNLHDVIKSLGIYIDKDLSFEYHIMKKCQIAYSKLKILYQFRELLPSSTKYRVANSLILSQIDYGLTIFYGLLTENNKKRLQVVQNSCLRFAYFIPRRQHITPYFIEYKLLKLQFRYAYLFLVFLFKVLTSRKPEYLLTILSFVNVDKSLRRQLMAIPKHNTSKFEGGFRYCASSYYNEYYDLFTNTNSTYLFKVKLKNKLLLVQSTQ